MKIIIKTPNWIGDTIMMTPAVARLRKVVADAHITALGPKGCIEVLKNNPSIDELWVSNEKEGLSAFLGVAKKIRKAKFDLGILMPNSFSSAMMFFLGRVKKRIGYDRDKRGFLLTEKIKMTRERGRMHQVDYYLELLNPLENFPDYATWEQIVKNDEKKMIYSIAPNEQTEALQYLKSKGVWENDFVAALNPGGFYGPSKRWLADRFAKVADYLTQKYEAKVFVLGSPAEGVIAEEIRKNAKRPVIDATQDMSLRLLGAFLERCSLMITNDSGSMHIGAAIGCPMVAIFGPTDPELTSPYSRKSIVLYKKAECAPCFLRECPIDHRCMTAIEVENVTRAIVQILDKNMYVTDDARNDKRSK